MIPNGEGWHSLALERLSALLRGITSKRVGYFYYLNCLHWCRTKSKLESQEKIFENKIFMVLYCPLKTLRY